MICKLLVKKVYGKTLYYPANNVSEILIKLTDRKAFRDSEMVLLKSLNDLKIELEFSSDHIAGPKI